MPALNFDITFNINRLPLVPVWFSTAAMPLNSRIAAKMEYAPHSSGRGWRLIARIQQVASPAPQYAARQLAVTDMSKRACTLLALVTAPQSSPHPPQSHRDG
jgi:hypothetical protein